MRESGPIALAERGLIPDRLVRWGIRRLCGRRLAEVARLQGTSALVEAMGRAPVAPLPAKANEQHYELPPGFFRLALGPRLKYSSAYWPDGVEGLDAAEEAMLALSAERAQLRDGLRILELGCGWGSLTLWMAERFPGASIQAVSNSAPQREFILAEAKARGLGNVEVLTRDMNVFEALEPFDRVVSVEMFEHMRNYGELLRRVHGWLRPGGKLFVHVFCHRAYAYPFEAEGSDDWMGRHFFTAGLMPSADLLPRFAGAFRLEERWLMEGTHYQRTAEAWLANLDRLRPEALTVLRRAYGASAPLWLERWRIFFMACAELFGYRGGTEWLVAHYRFAKEGGQGV